MKRLLPLILIVLVAAGALGGGYYLYRSQVAQLSAAQPDTVTAAKAPASDEHSRGNPDAPVVLEEFGDYQCPPCAGVAFTLPRIEHDYGPKLRVVFRHLPLAGHKHALEAARFAEAAALQGKFWDMHELIYKNKDAWNQADAITDQFIEYASSLGLDLDRLRVDLESDGVRERIAKDQLRAADRGVTATPTIFINGKLVPPPSLSEGGLRLAIDAALSEATASPAPQP
jgi:protein-disulfide isomerase